MLQVENKLKYIDTGLTYNLLQTRKIVHYSFFMSDFSQVFLCHLKRCHIYPRPYIIDKRKPNMTVDLISFEHWCFRNCRLTKKYH